MAKHDFQISVRTALSLGAGAMVLLTAALIQIPWSITSSSNVTALNSGLNAEVIDGIGRRTSAGSLLHHPGALLAFCG